MNKFYWGCASSASQVEGAYKKDGKGYNCWDLFCDTKGLIANGDTNKVACDEYNRIDETIALLKELGVNAYRFSLSWSRILPNGIGKVNKKGLMYYDRLIDKLIKNHIEPFVTIFHWDMPISLYNKGGLLSKESIRYFKEYTEVVVKAFHKKVKYWITLNEPQCIVGGNSGTIPGKIYTDKEYLTMVHHMLLVHGHMMKILHKYKVKGSFASTFAPSIPLNKNSKLDQKACVENWEIMNRKCPWEHSIFVEPVMRGHYPKKIYKVYDKKDIPAFSKNDMKIISEPMDYFATNIYFGKTCTYDKKRKVKIYEDYKNGKTTMGWPITDDALYWGCKYLYKKYKLPIFITENGAAFKDRLSNNKIHDIKRSKYINNYIKYLLKAKKEGIKINGYFYWSLLDNFEWFKGYEPKFGLVNVNFKNQKRTKKDSFYTYQKIIRNNK